MQRGVHVGLGARCDRRGSSSQSPAPGACPALHGPHMGPFSPFRGVSDRTEAPVPSLLPPAGAPCPLCSWVPHRQVHKLLIVVELLLGEIPDRLQFRQPSLKRSLMPYFLLTQGTAGPARRAGQTPGAGASPVGLPVCVS